LPGLLGKVLYCDQLVFEEVMAVALFSVNLKGELDIEVLVLD